VADSFPKQKTQNPDDRPLKGPYRRGRKKKERKSEKLGLGGLATEAAQGADYPASGRGKSARRFGKRLLAGR